MQVRRLLTAEFKLTSSVVGKVKLPLLQRLAIKSAPFVPRDGEVFGGMLIQISETHFVLELVESLFSHKQQAGKKIPLFRFPKWMRGSKLDKMLDAIEKISSVPINELARYNAPQWTTHRLTDEELKQLLSEKDTIDLTKGVRTGKYLVLILHENKGVCQVMSAATGGAINKQIATSDDPMWSNAVDRQKSELGLTFDKEKGEFASYYLVDGSMNHFVVRCEYGAEVLGTFAQRTNQFITGRLILPATPEAVEELGDTFEHNGKTYKVWSGIHMIAREEWSPNN